MKRIQKGSPPGIYSQWCESVVGTSQSDYRDIPGDAKQALLVALLQEQGALCAYTMRRINQLSSHTEHIKPQARCRADQPGSDLDYANLVACFPRADMSSAYRYGAQQKADWWEDDGTHFVSPLHPSCETRFAFDLHGNIAPVNNNESAVTTISILKLDHPTLTEDRKRVIEEFIYGPNRDTPLSPSKATQAIAVVCDRNNQACFYEFCIAIRDALQDYMNMLARRARRRKFAQRRG